MSEPPAPPTEATSAHLTPRLPSRAVEWLGVFGPGAIIASLTIGAGELVFSSRAGALFGYRLLWFFLVILVCKWVLVFSVGRHMVLTGAHPFQRWMELPGPRGWLPAVFFLLALAAFPVWVCFHAATIGTLLAWLTGTTAACHGTAHWLWGMSVLGAVMLLVLSGGYQTLERLQLAIVLLMLLCVLISLVLVHPDWQALLLGLVAPQPVAYPAWALSLGEFAGRPVWVEAITYVGVLGGSGYDYLAYVTYLRDKGWGRAGQRVATAAEVAATAADARHPDRRWLRVLAADSVLSFAAVLIFSAVFVACGAVLLGPRHQVPSGNDLLTLQAQFVAPGYDWMKPVYFVGAFLTMFGTLYGTIEVAPAILRELAQAFRAQSTALVPARVRPWAVGWAGGGGWLVLVACFAWHRFGSGNNPPGLVALLTPANLFTGVLGCGLVCLLGLWADRRFLPRGLRPGRAQTGLTILAGAAFILLGLKGYWDHSGWVAFGILAGTLAVGWIAAHIAQLRGRPAAGA
jgi:hypothetical protein